VEVPVRVGGRPEDAVRDRNAGVAAVGHDELATQCGACFRVQEYDAAIRAAHAARHIVLEQQQVVQVVRRNECRRADIEQPSFDQIERRMGAQLPGIRDHVVAAEPAGNDCPQQPG